MTIVNIKAQQRAAGGQRLGVAGTYSWTPTRRTVDGDAVLLPAPFLVVVPAAGGPVEVEPTGAGWAWRVSERMAGGAPGVTRTVVVPSSAEALAYSQLQDVDPASLDEGAEPPQVWWVALEALAAGGGGGGTVTPYKLTIGTVTTGAAGSTASATITGAAPNQVLNLVIPRGNVGATGTPGAPGIQGLKGDSGDQGVQGLKGDKGDAGTQGIQGIQGLKGDAGAQGAAGRNPVIVSATAPTTDGTYDVWLKPVTP